MCTILVCKPILVFLGFSLISYITNILPFAFLFSLSTHPVASTMRSGVLVVGVLLVADGLSATEVLGLDRSSIPILRLAAHIRAIKERPFFMLSLVCLECLCRVMSRQI